MPWQIDFDKERKIVSLTFQSDVSEKDVHESILWLPITHPEPL